jgi:hypothetical protein
LRQEVGDEVNKNRTTVDEMLSRQLHLPGMNLINHTQETDREDIPV